MASVLVFGEILFDIFGKERKIGGAPFNFAAHFANLSGKADLVSAIGKDDLGALAKEELRKRKVGSHYVAELQDKETGSSVVTLTEGTPSYLLKENVAYDFIPLPKETDFSHDVLYFGSLSSRNAVSKETLFSLFPRFPKKFFDVNIRSPFYTMDFIEKGLGSASTVKVSREEAPLLSPYENEEQFATALLQKYENIETVLVTLDKDGAFVKTRKGDCFHSEKPESPVVSTVGAGDSFSACYLYNILKGCSPKEALERGVLLSDYVVTKTEAVPQIPKELLLKIR